MELDFDKLGGLVPAVAQDYTSGEVLMVGFMNQQALETTLATGELTFYSRTRRRLWKKGERSGHHLLVRELRVDCDADAVLARVEPRGPGVCHRGYRRCFYRRLEPDGTAAATEAPAFDPETIYGEGSQP